MAARSLVFRVDDASRSVHMTTFSVVIASFNAAETLQRCLDSVWAQVHADTQVVVMDGGSTDATNG